NINIIDKNADLNGILLKANVAQPEIDSAFKPKDNTAITANLYKTILEKSTVDARLNNFTSLSETEKTATYTNLSNIKDSAGKNPQMPRWVTVDEIKKCLPANMTDKDGAAKFIFAEIQYDRICNEYPDLKGQMDAEKSN